MDASASPRVSCLQLVILCEFNTIITRVHRLCVARDNSRYNLRAVHVSQLYMERLKLLVVVCCQLLNY